MSGGTGGQVNGPYGRYTASATDPNQAVRGGSGGFMNQFISPGAAGMGPNAYGSGMLNGGPQANFNWQNRQGGNPYKGGTTSQQMQDNVLRYWRDKEAAEAAASGAAPSPKSNDVLGTDMDPRRSPDVAAPWRISMPYNGPVTGNVQTPNPTGYYPYGANASPGNAAAGGVVDRMASPSPGGAPMQVGDSSIPNWGAPTRPNMYAGGNPNFNERAPGYNGLLGRGSYR